MNQSNQEKYTVAWFKLAEFVARGEKERALALYRLLAHSFDDAALGHQLEGDLFGSFDDEQALASYEKAMEQYRLQHRLVEAAAVADHLISLKPDSVYYCKKAVSFYTDLGYTRPLVRTYCALIHAWRLNKKFEECSSLLNDLPVSLSKADIFKLVEHLVKEIIPHASRPFTQELIEGLVLWCNDQSNTPYLQNLLMLLKAADSQWYDYATGLL